MPPNARAIADCIQMVINLATILGVAVDAIQPDEPDPVGCARRIAEAVARQAQRARNGRDTRPHAPVVVDVTPAE
jgi:hypothetical protein